MGIFVARTSHFRRPIPKGVEKLAVDEVRHVNGAHREVILDIVHPVQKLASVGVRHPRISSMKACFVGSIKKRTILRRLSIIAEDFACLFRAPE